MNKVSDKFKEESQEVVVNLLSNNKKLVVALYFDKNLFVKYLYALDSKQTSKKRKNLIKIRTSFL